MDVLALILNGFRTLRSKDSYFDLWFVAIILVTVFGFTACTIRTPGTVQPTPNNVGKTTSLQKIDKSFFVGVDSKGRKKQFLCGISSETEIGWISEMAALNGYQTADNCNLEFEITELQLLAKLVDSDTNDRNKWKTVFSIPITRHYYYEPKLDANGRATNEYIYNESRSHWSARPNMDIDLSRINIMEWKFALTWTGSNSTLSVDGIEWDHERNFLGFTIAVSDHALGTMNQGRYRINFLKFEHNPKFQKNFFNDSNYEHLNVLNILGGRDEGLNRVNFAGYWDLDKNPKVYLHGFPQEYIPLAEKVVNDWNKTLRNAGALKNGRKGFTLVKDKQTPYAFDLRYPTINWVSDKRISANSPLGIGMGIADVRNGEILWGGITMYGGLIEDIFNGYMDADLGLAGTNNYGSFLKGRFDFGNMAQIPSNMMSFAQGLASSQRELKMKNLMTSIHDNTKQKSGEAAAARIELLNETFKTTLPQALIQRIFQDAQTDSAEQITKSQSLFSKAGLESSMTQQFDELNKKFLESNPNAALASEKNKEQTEDQIKKMARSNRFCQDRRAHHVAAEWGQGLSEQSDLNKTKVIHHVIEELMSHEYGHFLGLGHQFKENILPETGTVPQIYITGGRDSNGTIWPNQKELATEKKGFLNYTSVMGYRNARTEIAASRLPLAPGKQDELSLALLYTRRYPTYKPGDADFKMVQLPEGNDVIPATDPSDSSRKRAFFPQCNDIEASLGMNPFCNRWDRGNTATEIVTHYMNSLTDNFTQTINAFSDARGGNMYSHQGYLWYRSLDMTGRSRLFYDFMRAKYQKEINSISKDESAVREFSPACRTGQTNNPKLQAIFAGKPELMDLCRANAKVLDYFKILVSLNAADRSTWDGLNTLAPGGLTGGSAIRNYSRWLGTWSQLGALPLKYSALWSLTDTAPYIGMGSYAIMTNPSYDNAKWRFTYSSLYPVEYTKILAATVKHNLKFANQGQSDRTYIEQSVLSMGFFQWINQFNLDKQRFNERLLEKVRKQTQFNPGYVAIVMTGNDKKFKTNYVDSFTSVIYDLQADKEIPGATAYLLPGGRVIAKSEKMLILPVTPLRLFSDKSGYALGIKLDINYDPEDDFDAIGTANMLKNMYQTAVNSCIDGEATPKGELNGLSSYFNQSETDFEGFFMEPGIVLDESGQKQANFLKSIRTAFQKYWAYSAKYGNKTPSEDTCLEALKGISMVVSTGALINQYYLPSLINHVE